MPQQQQNSNSSGGGGGTSQQQQQNTTPISNSNNLSSSINSNSNSTSINTGKPPSRNSTTSSSSGGGATSTGNNINDTNNTSTSSSSSSSTAVATTTAGGGDRGGSGGDDLGSTDEVKVFKDEGDCDEEKITENLLEEKSSLIDLTESEFFIQEKSGKHHSSRQHDHSPVFGKLEHHNHAAAAAAASFNMGYLVSPYSYTNGSASGLPVSMANKMGLPPFFCHNGDHLTTPPPAHCGIPPYQLDPKSIGLPRPSIYPFPTSQYAYPMLSPDMSQVPTWHTPVYSAAAAGFRSPYPTSLPINTSLASDFYRLSPSFLPHHHHHVLNSHPAIVTPGPKQEIIGTPELNHPHHHRYGRTPSHNNTSHHETHHISHHHHHHSGGGGGISQHQSQKSTGSSGMVGTGGNGNNGNIQSEASIKEANEKKKPHIKKPLNAFMLYMKEMRAKVVAECTLKESAAINQILGRKWHELSRDEQSQYYDKARQERQAHMELYPGWSARDNYGYGSKKKKRKKDRSPADSGGNNMKKCRARYGLDQQNQWCKPCRRKKKCIRYMEQEGATTTSGGNIATSIINSSGGLLENSDETTLDLDGRTNLSEDIENMSSCGGSIDNDSVHNNHHNNHHHHNSHHHQSIRSQHYDDVNDDDETESINQSISSPLSALSSLQSPSTTASLASPLNLLMSASSNNDVASPVHQYTANNNINGFLYNPNKMIKIEFDNTNSVSSSQHQQQPPISATSSSSNLYNNYPRTTAPVGANPRDHNNPLSVNQLTKRDYINHNSPANSTSSCSSSSGSSLSQLSVSPPSNLVVLPINNSNSSTFHQQQNNSYHHPTTNQFLQHQQNQQAHRLAHFHHHHFGNGGSSASNQSAGPQVSSPSPNSYHHHHILHHHHHHHLAAAAAAAAAAAVQTSAATQLINHQAVLNVNTIKSSSSPVTSSSSSSATSSDSAVGAISVT